MPFHAHNKHPHRQRIERVSAARRQLSMDTTRSGGSPTLCDGMRRAYTAGPPGSRHSTALADCGSQQPAGTGAIGQRRERRGGPGARTCPRPVGSALPPPAARAVPVRHPSQFASERGGPFRRRERRSGRTCRSPSRRARRRMQPNERFFPPGGSPRRRPPRPRLLPTPLCTRTSNPIHPPDDDASRSGLACVTFGSRAAFNTAFSPPSSRPRPGACDADRDRAQVSGARPRGRCPGE